LIANARLVRSIAWAWPSASFAAAVSGLRHLDDRQGHVARGHGAGRRIVGNQREAVAALGVEVGRRDQAHGAIVVEGQQSGVGPGQLPEHVVGVLVGRHGLIDHRARRTALHDVAGRL
jgi:hypothetical protein